MITTEKELNYITEYAQLYYKKFSPHNTIMHEPLEYTLFAGGKYLRSLLCLVFAQLFNAKREDIIPFAFAIEMIHTYSLIHDDLPALDNDSLRRGQASQHIVFGEAKAILTGDALLTDAFYAMTTASVPAELLVNAIKDISHAAGSVGMVAGQVLDLENVVEGTSLESILKIHSMKTGAIFISSCKTGAILAGASMEAIEHSANFGKYFGLAFQILDDILDEIGNPEELGKTLGKDKASGKQSAIHLLGITEAKKMALEYFLSAKEIVEQLSTHSKALHKKHYTMLLYDIIQKRIDLLE